jgi:hypothetical protein
MQCDLVEQWALQVALLPSVNTSELIAWNCTSVPFFLAVLHSFIIFYSYTFFIAFFQIRIYFIFLANLEDEFHRSVSSLQNFSNDFDMEISTEKTKAVAFQANFPIRGKIVICNWTSHFFNNLGIMSDVKMKKV